jgi:hypothetical protein
MIKRATIGLYKPDLRGEFLRAWDNGRGVDAGREIGTWQEDAIRNIKTKNESCHFSQVLDAIYSDGPFVWHDHNTPFTISKTWAGGGGGPFTVRWLDFDASRVVPTAAENRPRSLAYPKYIYAGHPQ